MAENRHDQPAPYTPPDLTKPENRHEVTDVNVYAIGKFAIGLILTTIFCVALMIGTFQYLLHRVGGQPPTRLGQPTTDARQLPPEPRLEETPAADLGEMRAAEDHVLTSYRWIDQSAGIVGLPIDRAMDLVAQRGLPARQSGPQSAAADVTVPTMSALGQKMQAVGGPLANPTGQPTAPPPPGTGGETHLQGGQNPQNPYTPGQVRPGVTPGKK